MLNVDYDIDLHSIGGKLKKGKIKESVPEFALSHCTCNGREDKRLGNLPKNKSLL